MFTPCDGGRPVREGASPHAADAPWRIRTRAADADIEVIPAISGQLHWRPATGGEAGWWETSGEHPCFRLDASALQRSLPAGWYALSCRFEVLSGSVMLASLSVGNGHPGALPGREMLLPDPDAEGNVFTLLLFVEDVVRLDFYPSVYPVQFRLHDVTLRQVSRIQALRCMFRGLAPTGLPRFARSTAWAFGAARHGRRRATDALYADYCRHQRPQETSEYEVWCRKYDSLNDLTRAALGESADRLAERGPTISVLLPVYNTPEGWLRRCLDSVLAQIWEKWELCVADDASTEAHVATVLAEYAARDARIHVTRRDRNGHIAAASNTALAMARGDVVALLDHDDELRPQALLRVAEALAANADTAIIYSDEDKLDAHGIRFDPNFKPDWNPDLLHGQNYVCHLCAIRADLVRDVGGFREGFEGSQDFDLVLRCVERVKPAQICHIAEILYHWRAIEGSTAMVRDAKDYASAAGIKALVDHFERTDVAARVQNEGLPPTLYRVRWPVPDPAPKISLIIPTRDREQLLRTCVESILAKSTYPDFELVVVDNQSSDAAALDYLREIDRRDRVRVLRYDAPFNYSAINNWAVQQCDGTLIGLINNDIEVITPDWMEEMAGFALRADTGVAGAMLYYPDDTIQHAGVIVGILGVAGHVNVHRPRGWPGYMGRGLVAQDMSAVTGACLLVRRQVFEEVGGLDEALTVAFNDIDFCLRVRDRGYRNVWTPFAELYHHESASRGLENTGEKVARFNAEIAFMQQRWGDALLQDPAYNPNLSLQSNDFELAFPPRTH